MVIVPVFIPNRAYQNSVSADSIAPTTKADCFIFATLYSLGALFGISMLSIFLFKMLTNPSVPVPLHFVFSIFWSFMLVTLSTFAYLMWKDAFTFDARMAKKKNLVKV